MAPVAQLGVLLAALAAIALTTLSSFAAGEATGPSAEPAADAEPAATRPAVEARGTRPSERSPRARPVEDRRPAATQAADAHPRLVASAPRRFLARIERGESVVVRNRPGGRAIGRLGSRTRFGSSQVLAVFAKRGRWLGVASSARTDGRIAWVDRRSGALRVVAAPVTIRADLSRRRVELRRGSRVVERATVAVGRPVSPTPTGRFAITDKLNGRERSPYYGCCILALSGTQPDPPPGWTGGNRLALHGTNSPRTIGMASSAGCLRASDSELRRLMRRVPLGTPVEIRR